MTSWTHLASDWLAISTGDEMRFSRGEINDYYPIYTMTTSPYLYISTIYSYWRTSPSLHKLYNIQLQHFRAKFFYMYHKLLFLSPSWGRKRNHFKVISLPEHYLLFLYKHRSIFHARCRIQEMLKLDQIPFLAPKHVGKFEAWEDKCIALVPSGL